ncbi:unnamed protein product [Chilo suppressalis]|uniref:Protein krueppel n=1 Tax=Chilo suppressalis TaxID=168631 RepID=A0ABN8B772_CHISP|nr:unnamed protein product [Chilo suppressalis]
MVGPLLLLKMLHCRKKCQKSSSSHSAKSGLPERRRSKRSHRNFKENSCRVCLKEGDIPIYGDQATDDIPRALSTLAGIEIDEEDTYPKYLCHSCHALLQGAILLRKTAQQSQKVLKKSSKRVLPPSSPINPETSKESNTLSDLGDDLDDNTLDCDEGEEEKKNYFCSRCDIAFASLKEYCDHRLSEDHENKRITCPVCNKSYSAMYYKKHMAIHQPDCPYMCDICGKKFIIQGQFSRHRLTHFFKLPYKCGLCPYRGRFTESLKMHMRIHTGEKPYQCSECAARFVSKSNLNKHMYTHKDHDFKCESCGRGFYTKRNLEMHIKVDHVGIRDHLCNICGKAFGYRKQMMKHQLKVHKRQKLRSGRMPLYLQVEKMGENVET